MLGQQIAATLLGGFLLCAMRAGADAQIVNGSFEDGTGLPNAWTVAGAALVTNSIIADATDGDLLLELSTGPGAIGVPQLQAFLGISLDDEAEEGSAITPSLLSSVAAGDHLAIDWNFFTSEPIPSVNNDFAFVVVAGEIIPLADTASSFDASDTTGWETFCFTATSPGQPDFAAAVVDVGDTMGVSVLLLDHLRIVADTDEDGIPDPCDTCGDGVLDAHSIDDAEECDDGNQIDGDGCSAACEVEPCYVCLAEPSICLPVPDGTSCEDELFCNGAETCQSGSCVAGAEPCLSSERCNEETDVCDSNCPPAPFGACRNAAKSILLLKDSPSNDAKDKLSWKWIKGEATSPPELGDPTATTEYSLCLYAGSTSALIRQVDVPVSAALWEPIGDKGYKYKHKLAAFDGTKKVLLKGSEKNRSKAIFKGVGFALPDLLPGTLPFAGEDFPVVVELINNETGVCFGSSFDAGDVKKNVAEKFKAKAD